MIGQALVPDEISESVPACAFFVIVCGLMAVFFTRSVLGALFRMHRSKSAVRKLMKEYSFKEKLLLQPAYKDCIHAQRFARFYVWCHHIAAVVMIVLLLLAIFFSKLIPAEKYAYFSFMSIYFLDIPVSLIGLALTNEPLMKNRTGYRFERYNRTNEHNKLF